MQPYNQQQPQRRRWGGGDVPGQGAGPSGRPMAGVQSGGGGGGRRPLGPNVNRRSSPELPRQRSSNNRTPPEGGIPISDEDREIKKLAFGDIYSSAEESLRNDLNEAYLNTGRRPQNLLQGVALQDRFSEYPKLQKLITLHSDLVADHAHPPTYLEADLRSFAITSLLPVKYDCILIDPPLEEYTKDHPTHAPASWSWDEIAELPIPQIASNPGFVWLWVGSGKADENGVSGLDKGREILAKWGYRRCEDIVWLKTNTRKPGLENEPDTKTILTHTKEHCLMGIRGTVRRSTDSHFVHCNVDTDVIVWEGDEKDPLHKPPELYSLIENFCLGTRRLELFGSSKNARAGWLTVGTEVQPPLPMREYGPNEYPPQPYEKEVYDTYFSYEITNLVPSPAEIEALRPRSPGGPNKQMLPIMPGLKSNPQGIGRHTNRSATPSASQQLELQQMMQQQQQKQVQQQQQQRPIHHPPPPPPPAVQQQPVMRMGEQHASHPGVPPGQVGALGMSTGMNGPSVMMDQNALMMMQAMMAGQQANGQAGGMHAGAGGVYQGGGAAANGSMSPLSMQQQQQQQQHLSQMGMGMLMPGMQQGMGMMPSMMGLQGGGGFGGGAGQPHHPQQGFPGMGSGFMSPQQQQQMMAMMMAGHHNPQLMQQQQQQHQQQQFQARQPSPYQQLGGMSMNSMHLHGNGSGGSGYGQFY